MALNFPDSPTLNQVYTDTTSGFSYQWDGVVWQSYSPSASKNISIVDDISGSFDGVTDTFALSAYGATLAPANAQQLRVVLGGIVQEPAVDYTVSSGNIIFTTPPAGGLDCSIVSLGPALPQNNVVPVDGSVTEVKLANGSVTTIKLDDGSVTPAKLSTGGPSWNTDGDVVITGTGTTSLLVDGNARVTGILTVGTSSITLDGTSNEIKIGTAMTISSTGITGSASSVTSSSVSYGLSGTPNITVGFITATGTSVGGDVVVGSAVTLSSGGIEVVGVVTATSYIGDGSQLTGVGGESDITSCLFV